MVPVVVSELVPVDVTLVCIVVLPDEVPVDVEVDDCVVESVDEIVLLAVVRSQPGYSPESTAVITALSASLSSTGLVLTLSTKRIWPPKEQPKSPTTGLPGPVNSRTISVSFWATSGHCAWYNS